MLPLARQVTEYMFSWANTLPEDRRARLRGHALATQKEQRLRSMLNLAKAEKPIALLPEQIDAKPMLLGCSDGTLDLRTGKLRPPRREDFITKSTGVAYNPQAKCQHWLATMNWVTGGDPDTIEHIQRCAGYMLTGQVNEEKLFAFFGSGANGKTTVAMLLLDVLGEYAGKARKDLLLHSQGKEGEPRPMWRRCMESDLS
jgi:putative DNA primase/helicase